MRRRALIFAAVVAASASRAARAGAARPVVGFLNSRTPEQAASVAARVP
jgi:hypothetical protein